MELPRVMPAARVRPDQAALPPSVQEIADVIGRERALYLIGQLPQSGSRAWRVCLYVPKRLKPDCQLVRILGWSDAVLMAREFGGMILQPSNCRFLAREFRDREVRRMAVAGMRPRDIAETVELTERQVRNIIAAMTPEETAPLNDNLPQTGAQKRGHR